MHAKLLDDSQASCYNLNDDSIARYEDVFTGLGCLPGSYHIEIDETIEPVQHAPRRVPVGLKKELTEYLDSLVLK